MSGWCQNASFAHFLDTPEFFAVTMRTITFIGFPIHIFGAFCIIFKTPPQMVSMKWPMLNLHFWSVFMDITVGFLTIPFVYQPVLAGYSLGFLNEFKMHLGDMYYLCCVILASVMVSIALIFESRYYLLYARDTCWARLRRPWLLINYIVAFTYMIPTYLAIPDQNTGKRYQIGRYPCMPAEIYDDKVFLLTTWSTGLAYNACLNTGGQQALIFVGLIYWNMKKSMTRVKMSKKTLDLQRKFLRSLILQVTIPFVTVILPQIYTTLATYYSYYNQGANNLSYCVIATHGIVSSMTMIYLHKSYWEAMLCFIWPKFLVVDDGRMFTATK